MLIRQVTLPQDKSRHDAPPCKPSRPFRHVFLGLVSHRRTCFLLTTVRTASPRHAPPQRPKKKMGDSESQTETAAFNNRWHIWSRHEPQSDVGTAVSRWPPSTRKAQDDIAVPEAWTSNKTHMHACKSWMTQTQTLCTLAVLKDGGMQHTPVGSADKSSYSLGVSTSLQP